MIVNPSAANEFSMDATASAILSVLNGIFIHYRNKVLKVSLIEIGFCFTPKLAVLNVQLNTNRKLEVANWLKKKKNTPQQPRTVVSALIMTDRRIIQSPTWPKYFL